MRMRSPEPFRDFLHEVCADAADAAYEAANSSPNVPRKAGGAEQTAVWARNHMSPRWEVVVHVTVRRARREGGGER